MFVRVWVLHNKDDDGHLNGHWLGGATPPSLSNMKGAKLEIQPEQDDDRVTPKLFCQASAVVLQQSSMGLCRSLARTGLMAIAQILPTLTAYCLVNHDKAASRRFIYEYEALPCCNPHLWKPWDKIFREITSNRSGDDAPDIWRGRVEAELWKVLPRCLRGSFARSWEGSRFCSWLSLIPRGVGSDKATHGRLIFCHYWCWRVAAQYW